MEQLFDHQQLLITLKHFSCDVFINISQISFINISQNVRNVERYTVWRYWRLTIWIISLSTDVALLPRHLLRCVPSSRSLNQILNLFSHFKTLWAVTGLHPPAGHATSPILLETYPHSNRQIIVKMRRSSLSAASLTAIIYNSARDDVTICCWKSCCLRWCGHSVTFYLHFPAPFTVQLVHSRTIKNAELGAAIGLQLLDSNPKATLRKDLNLMIYSAILYYISQKSEGLITLYHRYLQESLLL